MRERTTKLGFLELDEVPSLMKRHDVFLCPSRYDGWGMVVPEALAAAMPAIVSNEVGSALDIGEHDFLRFFESGSVEGLSRQIEWFLDNAAAIPALGVKAKTLSEKYDSKVGAQKFVDLAMKAIKSH